MNHALLEERGRLRRAVGFPVLAAALLAAGCARPTVHASPPPAEVEVAPVVQRDVPVYGEWIGTLQGYENAQIQPQVSGYLIRQDYREGAFVRRGQVLFEIDPRPFQAALDQARAQLAQAQGQLAQAQAQLGNARLNVQRDLPEAQAQAIPQSQLDTDRQTGLAARAAVAAARGAVAAARAAIERAQLNLGFTRVRALIAGIAGIAKVQAGNLVGPQTVLTAVSQVDPIKCYFPITSQDYLRSRAAAAAGEATLLSTRHPVPLRLFLSGGEAFAHAGRLLFAGRAVDPATGTLQLVAAFPNPGGLLRPGQYGRVRAQTGMLQHALLVPQRAVIQLQGRTLLALVGPTRRVRVVPVEVGPRVGSDWVITGGLRPGERVIAEGAQKARDGALVAPVPYRPGKER